MVVFAGRNCCSTTMSALIAHCGLVVCGWIGHPQPPDRSQHGCQPGPTRVLPSPVWLGQQSVLAQALTQAPFHSKSLCCLTQGEYCLFLVCSVAIPATVFPSCLCGLAALVCRKDLDRDGRRWLSNTEDEVPGVGTGQAERVLADAITIDGRKKWIWNFCFETNVDTEGLQGKHEQAGLREEWKTGGLRISTVCAS